MNRSYRFVLAGGVMGIALSAYRPAFGQAPPPPPPPAPVQAAPVQPVAAPAPVQPAPVAAAPAAPVVAAPVAAVPLTPEESAAKLAELERQILEMQELIKYYKEAASDRSVLEHRINGLRAEVEQLHTDYDTLKVAPKHYRSHGVPGDDVVLDEHGPMEKKDEQKAQDALQALRLTADVTLRWVFQHAPDVQDLLLNDAQTWWAMRARVSATYDDPAALLTGGVRFSTGQNPNPTAAFFRIGDAFRPTAFPLDRYYFNLRPFENREMARVTVGKMPNPIWRGDRGGWRSELIWDTDVSPVGVSIYFQFFENEGIVIDNSVNYFVASFLQDFRFQGLTGETAIFAEQFRVRTDYLSLAFAYESIQNLNAGLYSPGITLSDGAELPRPTSAFLLRPGLFATNAHIQYQPGAIGFIADNYNILNPMLQGNIPIKALDFLGKTEIFVFGDLAYNLSVAKEGLGVGGTLGFISGDHGGGAIRPVQVWATYRYVEADATLATFADSDLGRGTDYMGLELGAQYGFSKNLTLVVAYYNFKAFPRMTLQNHTIDADLIWTY